MTATPGQAAPAAFARWYRIEQPNMPDEEVADMWRVATLPDREFWTEVQAAIAAQEPHAADGDGFTVHDPVRYPDEPQPAPELAATVLAEVLDFLDGGIPPGDEFALQVAQWRKRGLPS